MKTLIIISLLLITSSFFAQGRGTIRVEKEEPLAKVNCNTDSIEIKVFTKNISNENYKGRGEGFIRIKKKSRVASLSKKDKTKLINAARKMGCSTMFIDLNGVYGARGRQYYYYCACEIK